MSGTGARGAGRRGEDKNVSSDVLARRMTAVLVSVHLGCLVWRQAKLRNKRDDRVTHSGRMGKPTAPLTLYFSERGGRRAKVSSHLRFNVEDPAKISANNLNNVAWNVYCFGISTFWTYCDI